MLIKSGSRNMAYKMETATALQDIKSREIHSPGLSIGPRVSRACNFDYHRQRIGTRYEHRTVADEELVRLGEGIYNGVWKRQNTMHALWLNLD